LSTEIVKDPIYQQVNGVLRRLIRSGKYAVGTKFLTERQISERFEVSRVTANKALSNLVSEGLLLFKKGVGTFVNEVPLNADLGNLISFTERARSFGKTPTTEIVEFLETAGSSIPKRAKLKLNAADDLPVIYLRRKRSADAMPVILEDRWVNAARSPSLTREKAAGSLYRFWREEAGLDLAGAEATIRAVILSREESTLLKADFPSPGLLMLASGFVDGSFPLWYEETLYRGDAYEFNTRIGVSA
jgi:GntR family transcriptional regulator